MLFAPLAALAATLLSATGTQAAADWKTTRAASTASVVKGKYIIEYSSDASRKRGVDFHEHFDSHMKRAGLLYDVKSTFDAAGLFVGASIALADGDVDAVRALSSVEAVYPVKIVPRPRPYADRINGLTGPSANPTDTFSTHRMTGVDKLHNMGIYGAGVLVAEIDTGIDYTHPYLGNGCFGPGCKVVKGYDFVGDDYTGSNDPVPDDDPMDCAGHGTHVAGIIGADANPLNFTGVAPAASLAAYRVFGCDGNAQNDVIMAAMIRAYEDGADIISMSLGGPSGWTEDPEAVLASRLIKNGVVLSLANGNDGAEGLFYTSAPATAIGALAVSSVDNIVTPGMGVVVGDVTAVLSSEEPLGVSNTTAFPIYVASTDVDDEANLGCDPFGDDVDLDGKVAIVVRGVCAFADKALNVFNAGGSLMLIVNNAPGSLTADIGDVDIQSAILLQTDGAAIFAALAADPTLTATFPSTYFNFANNDTAGLVSDFTTYGLTNDGFLKPSIAAPGGNILSTWPVAKGSYTVISGTSMATPFISGVAALFISQNGAIDPLVLKAILETSSTTIPTTIGGSQLNTMAQAGSGLINAFDAVLFKTVVSPSEFSLNDTANAVTSGTITLDNTGSSATSYRISHLPAGTALTFGSTGAQPNLGPATLVDGAATVSFDTSFITVPAGGSAGVAVTFAAPSGLDASQVPVYSGLVHIESSDGLQIFNIPYAGVAASLKDDFPMLDTTSEFFETNFGIPAELPALIDYDGNFLTETVNFTFVDNDAPEILYRLLGGTPKLLVDLVEAETTFVPTFSRRSLLDPRRMLHRVKRAVPATPAILGNLFEVDYNSRNVPDSTDNGVGYFDYTISASAEGFTFGNGSTVPNGAYKVLVRALKIFGDETKPADYESWLSPTFGVNAAGVEPVGNTTLPDPAINTTVVVSTGASNTTSSALPAYSSAAAVIGNGTESTNSTSFP